MVRGPLCQGRRGMGPLQLRHASQLTGEAQLVPRPNIEERRRVPPFLGHQWLFPCEGERVLSRAEVHLAEV